MLKNSCKKTDLTSRRRATGTSRLLWQSRDPGIIFIGQPGGDTIVRLNQQVVAVAQGGLPAMQLVTPNAQWLGDGVGHRAPAGRHRVTMYVGSAAP